MAFSSLLFLTAFLPAYVALYWLSPRFMRNATLLALSIAFYAWGAPWFLPVLLALGVVDYYLALAIDARRGTRAARWIVTFAVAMHLSVLAYFKYSNFFVGEVDSLLMKLGLVTASPFHWTHVTLPIGVSFLTFEEISYVVDVYRGDAKPSKSIPQYLLFLMLFPHSIAGPIFRWKDLEGQLRSRNESLDDVVAGLTRFVWGLAKKILIADAAAVTADAAFSHGPTEISVGVAWLGALAYAIQIFYDFSGYSDMALGLGRIAGFRFKENFNDPYSSASITEFWTRWHMSLSSWLRDYLYIPLGGNRHGERRTRINVLLVFTLSGLWHGASWTFVLWGLYHGLLNLFERTTLGRRWRDLTPRWFAIPFTFGLVVIGWVFFRAHDVEQAAAFLKAMAGLGSTPAAAKLVPALLAPNRSIFFITLGVFFVIVRAAFGRPRQDGKWRWVYIGTAPALLLLSLIQIVNTKFVPLIYFKF
ncbi:MAG: MBOAT family protein [Labilithrix sp.]|nr:MBOAT family protein [Labilithrix sp.]